MSFCHLFDVIELPGLVEIGFLWRVETEIRKPPLAWIGLDPIGCRSPLNSFDTGAGLDASPAVWRHLGLTENEVTVWRFVDAADVPPGPWTEVVTTSGNNRLT